MSYCYSKDLVIDTKTNTITIEIVKSFKEDGIYDKMSNKMMKYINVNINEYETNATINVFAKGKVNISINANAQNYLLLNYRSLNGIRSLFNTNCKINITYNW